MNSQPNVNPRGLTLFLRALKRVVGEHHPLGMSVFVNHSPDLLAKRYGVSESDKARTGES